MSELKFIEADPQKDYQQVLADLRSDRAQLVDIREKKEWEQNRFKCAIHVPSRPPTKRSICTAVPATG
jgi:hypothetical protein